ncbi:PucR family transcriptional regulator [Paenibacillus humicola]|uniref:PucR family transcriptional regulator n=1 Tax=Paenibacillus humicola TaxID=3110540 RepID=UPI00237BD06F|nr:PucR family transcriptional regulator [Paenibacillus humicola]
MEGISVGELLEKRSHLFGKQPILAGKSGIHRLVTNVNVMEVPDIYEQVRVGDLLLTTGFSIKDNVAAQEKLILGLAERNISAIAIKRKRYIHTLPPKMLEHADSCRIPIIDLSMDTNFSLVISEVHDEMLSRKLRMINEVHQSLHHLTQLLVMGESLKTFVDHLSHDLGREFSLLTYKDERIRPVEGLEWPDGILRPGRQTRVQAFEGMKIMYSGGARSCCWIPVERNTELLGYLAYEEGAGGELPPSAVMILQHAVKLLALKLTNQYGISRVEERFKEIFLRKWILGEITQKETILLQASSVGLSLREHYVLILTSITGELPLQERLMHNKSFVQQELLIVPIDRQLAVLVPERLYSGGGFSISQLEQALKQAARLSSVRLGVSAAKPIDRIGEAYREAKDALAIFSAIDPGRTFCHYEQLGIYHSLYGIAGSEELIASGLFILKPLLGGGSKQNEELLETLTCYILTSGNVKETAKTLYRHYNSVLYRLERIESILQLSVRDPEHSFRLQLAVRLYEFMKKLDPQRLAAAVRKLGA